MNANEVLFNQSGCQSIANNPDHNHGYIYLQQAFDVEYQNAESCGQSEHAKILKLMSDICSMQFQLDKPQEPFKPWLELQNGLTSTSLDDISSSDLDFFESIIDSIDNHLLRARVLDILWLKKIPKNPKFALTAITAYREQPFCSDNWFTGVYDCWDRALCLSTSLKSMSNVNLADFVHQIIAKLNASTVDDKFFASKLAELLVNHKVLDKPQTKVVAEKLETLAKIFDTNSDYDSARRYYEFSAKIFFKNKQFDKVAELKKHEAEAYVKEAQARPEVAPYFIEKAIEIYRSIPKEFRVDQINARIEGLYPMLREATLLSNKNMQKIEVRFPERPEVIRESEETVSGLPFAEAFFKFILIDKLPTKASIQTSALETVKTSLIHHFSVSIRRTHDGRTAAKTPPVSGSPSIEDKAVAEQMIQTYAMRIFCSVIYYILPALRVMQKEHLLSESEFVEMAEKSPIVPGGRAKLFGRALYEGYKGDFIAAIHFLVPQVEHMVRTLLRQAGAKTTTLKDGVETENGLSALVELPQINSVLDENIVFAIKALFCDAVGPNLRNNLAHGLLELEHCDTSYVVYAWWLILGLVYESFMNNRL